MNAAYIIKAKSKAVSSAPAKNTASFLDDDAVPKTQFSQVYGRWEAAHFITILKTKAGISVHNLDNYLAGLREYLRGNLGQRWSGVENCLEFDIDLIVRNSDENKFVTLGSCRVVLSKWRYFDAVFDAIAISIKAAYDEMLEDGEVLFGDIDQCLMHDYTPNVLAQMHALFEKHGMCRPTDAR